MSNLVDPERELTSLRKMYGEKFKAICAALRHVSEMVDDLDEQIVTDSFEEHLNRAMEILIDA